MAVQEIPVAFFHLENDNVYFRGIDSGQEFEGYACPLFSRDMGNMVARNLSTKEFRVEYDKEVESFVVVQGNKRTVLPIYECNGERMYGFWGWTWIMEGITRTDAG